LPARKAQPAATTKHQRALRDTFSKYKEGLSANDNNKAGTIKNLQSKMKNIPSNSLTFSPGYSPVKKVIKIKPTAIEEPA